MFITAQTYPRTLEHCNHYRSSLLQQIVGKIALLAIGIFAAYSYFSQSPFKFVIVATVICFFVKPEFIESFLKCVSRPIKIFKAAFINSTPLIQKEFNHLYDSTKKKLLALTPSQEYTLLEALSQTLDEKNLPILEESYLYPNQKIAIALYLLSKQHLDPNSHQQLIENCWEEALKPLKQNSFSATELDSLLSNCQLCEKLPSQKPIEQWTVRFENGDTISYPFYYKEIFVRLSSRLHYLCSKTQEGSTVLLRAITKEDFEIFINGWTVNVKKSSLRQSLERCLRFYVLCDYYQFDWQAIQSRLISYIRGLEIQSHEDRAFALAFMKHLKNEAGPYNKKKLSKKGLCLKSCSQALKEKIFESFLESFSCLSWIYPLIRQRELDLLKDLKLKKFEAPFNITKLFNRYYRKPIYLTDRVFAKMIPYLPNLREIDFSNCELLTNKSIEILKDLPIFPSLRVSHRLEFKGKITQKGIRDFYAHKYLLSPSSFLKLEVSETEAVFLYVGSN